MMQQDTQLPPSSEHGLDRPRLPSVTKPRMPAAFQLLNRKPFKSNHAEKSLAKLEPIPMAPKLVGRRPLHRRVSSRSCEVPRVTTPLYQQQRHPQSSRPAGPHNRHVTRDDEEEEDLADVLDLYHERDSNDSDQEALQNDLASVPSISDHQEETTLSQHSTDTRETASRALNPNTSFHQTAKDETHDRYGFQCETQHVSLDAYKTWAITYEEVLARRRKKWDVLLQEAGLSPSEGPPIHFPARSTKVQRYVRKGIPPDYRGQAWFFYAGGSDKVRQNPGLYDKLISTTSAADDLNMELIERDVHRTFPDNLRYKPVGYVKPIQSSHNSAIVDIHEPVLIGSLRRVLQAYALYRPQVGYCQSFNFLAGLFLLFLDEEKSFWMLVITTTEYLPNVHDTNLEGANIDQAVLMLAIRESLPNIWSKMVGDIDGPSTQGEPSISEIVTKLPPITLVTAAWFMSAYTGSLPIETTLRVWDCFFYEGSKVLFRIALTILKLGEPQILAAQEFIEIFQIVQSLPRSMLDPTTLIEACFRRRNGVGHLSQKEVDQKRGKVARLRQQGISHRVSRDDIRVAGGSRPQVSSRSLFKR